MSGNVWMFSDEIDDEDMKELTKTKDKVIKTQKNITNFLHHARSFDFSN